MKILHTSDWHLGRTLYGRKCTLEFQLFLDWLLEEIERQKADYLLVAGDIFDSTTPSNTSLSQYYSFLNRVSKTCCKQVIVIGGNHDSPSLLNAPREILRQLNTTVIGSSTANPEDEVITLDDADGNTEAIVCAVPYLRDRDVRSSEIHESIDDKARKLVAGIADHYQRVVEIAQLKQSQCNHKVPIIGMGHLFAAGGKVAENNEVRDLYIGTLAHVHTSCFPKAFDYLALGHLHIAQEISSSTKIRYSGSPMQLSFGRENQHKSITAVSFSPQISIDTIAVPPFLHLVTLTGSKEDIHSQIEELLTKDHPALIEVHYGGTDIATLREEIEKQLAGTKLELIRIINTGSPAISWQQQIEHEALEELEELDVFRKCLDAHEIAEKEREELEYCFTRILELIGEEDDIEEGK